MKDRYASMPNWLFNWFGITEEQDQGPFRMHDMDYGTAGNTLNGWPRAKTRAEADRNLRTRLVEYRMKPWRAWLIWLGCRALVANKWRPPMIILTAEQADFARGDTSHGTALNPVALLDGSFVLPEAVLTDPAHERLHEYLSALPLREVDSSEFPREEEA